MKQTEIAMTMSLIEWLNMFMNAIGIGSRHFIREGLIRLPDQLKCSLTKNFQAVKKSMSQNIQLNCIMK